MASKLLKRLTSNRFVNFGLPFMVLLVGGSFGLQQFAQLRYTFRNRKLMSPEEAEQLGIRMKPKEEKPTIESEYEKMKKIEIDTWQNIRGPRPWEDSKTVQELQKTSGM